MKVEVAWYKTAIFILQQEMQLTDSSTISVVLIVRRGVRKP